MTSDEVNNTVLAR